METAAPYETAARRVPKVLPVKLTPEEIRRTGRTLVALMDERDATSRNLSLHNKQTREKLDELNGELARFRRMVATETEDREVECEERLDHSAGQVVVVRTDTGEIVMTRPMTEEEHFLGMNVDTTKRPG